MKHKNIAKLLGWTEVPVEEEGLFLQSHELEQVDTALGAEPHDMEAINANLAAAQTQAQELTSQVEALGSQLAEVSAREATQSTRIQELEAENARLAKAPSGKGSSLAHERDEVTTEGKKLTLNDPEHPLNMEAARRVAGHKAKAGSK